MPSEGRLRPAEAVAAPLIRVSMKYGYNRARLRNDRPIFRNALDTDRKTPTTDTRLGHTRNSFTRRRVATRGFQNRDSTRRGQRENAKIAAEL